MFFSIHVPGQKSPLQAVISLRELRQKRGFVAVQPGQVYWLRVYQEKTESPVDWAPQDEPGLVVLKFSRKPAEPGWEPVVDDSLRLVCRVQFRVDNENALHRLLRWEFRDPQSTDEYATVRVPMLVRARFKLQMLIGVTFAIGLAITELFEPFSLWVGSGFDEAQLPMTLLSGAGAATVIVLGLVLLGFWLINGIGLAHWIAKESVD